MTHMTHMTHMTRMTTCICLCAGLLRSWLYSGQALEPHLLPLVSHSDSDFEMHDTQVRDHDALIAWSSG